MKIVHKALLFSLALLAQASRATLFERYHLEKTSGTTAVKEEENYMPDEGEDPNVTQLRGKKITTIDIEGIDDKEQLKNAQLFLSLKTSDEIIEQAEYFNYLIKNGEKEIQKSQEVFGYYNVTVNSTVTEENEKEIKVTYKVTLGAVTKIIKSDIQLLGEAIKDPVFLKIANHPPFKVGDSLNHEQYEDYKSQWISTAAVRGYFDGHFLEKTVYVNTDVNKASVHLHYDSGTRYKFGDIQYVNSEKGHQLPLSQDFLQRFTNFKKGEPFNAQTISKLQQDLQGTNYFYQVALNPLTDSEHKTVPYEAQLTMNKNKHYVFGLGYSTDMGVRGKFGFDRRWVNDRGHSFSSNLFASKNDSEFDNIYRIPAKNPATDYYFIRVGGRIKEDDYDTRRAFVEGGYEWQKGAWAYRVSATSAYEKFSIGNDKGNVWLTYPQFQVTYSSVADRLKPTEGYQVQANVLGGAENVLSDINFVQTNFKVRYLQPITQKDTINFRLDLGADWADNYHQLPPSFRYFAGGDKTLRGYAYEKIGYYDSSGKNIGGKYLAVSSLELAHTIKDNWALTTFIDVGDAFKNKFKPKVGAGFGVKWLSPVGAIRVDLGHGFDKEYGSTVRINLNIGTELDL